MKKVLLSCLSLAYGIYAQAQQLPDRYRQEVFSSSQVTTGVVFSTNIPTVRTTSLFGNQIANEESYGQRTVTLRMDIYRPSGDTLTKRPVIIFAFGGGFVNGSRTEASMIQLCQAFARRGFVTATIDYRLGMNISNEELSKRAVYRALQDGRSAVRFFRRNAAAYGVDPNQIYLSGHSAGSFLAYQAVYLDKDSERPASTRNYLGRADLGGLDAIGDNKTYANGALVDGKANGVMGFAGAIGNLTDIEGPADVPGVYFHSSDDNVVPFNSGEPFSTLSWLPGFNLPTVFGGSRMNDRAGAVSATRTFYPYTNRGHGVHYNGSGLYPDISSKGGQFFYDTRLRPANLPLILGNSSICSNCLTQTYSVANTAFYYDWQITGGTFVSRNPRSNQVTVTWNATATNRGITVTPYSRQLARGFSVGLGVNVNRTAVLSRVLDANTLSEGMINLNEYFTDPEGQPLNYTIKVVSNNQEGEKMANGNMLDVKSLAQGQSTIVIEVNDGSTCSTKHTVQMNIKNELQINVSPNPFVRDIQVSLTGQYKGDVKVIFYAENGRVIAEKASEKLDMNFVENFGIETAKKGVYYIKVITSEGEIIRRIVKN
ncbi:MAG: carboxylesterase family protein [Raineya sp.]|nr:carboxylesterase family protein [Raineya sp.]